MIIIDVIATTAGRRFRKSVCAADRASAARSVIVMTPKGSTEPTPYLAPRPEMATGQPETGKPLNNQDVLGMVEAGLPPKVLVAKIDRSPGAYDTSPDDLRQPKTAGVHDSIILAMVRAG